MYVLRHFLLWQKEPEVAIMKGLFYKDILTNLPDLFLLCMTHIFVVVAAVFLNSTDSDAPYCHARNTIIPIFVLVSIVSGIVIDICLKDNKTKWNIYVTAFPCGYQNVVKQKYCLDSIGHGISLISGSIFILTINQIFAVRMPACFLCLFIFIGISMVFHSLMLPLYIKQANHIAGFVLFLLLVLLLYGGFAYLAFGDLSALRIGDYLHSILQWSTENPIHVWMICTACLTTGVMAEIISCCFTTKAFLS